MSAFCKGLVAVVIVLGLLCSRTSVDAQTSCEREVQTVFSPDELKLPSSGEVTKGSMLEVMFDQVFVDDHYGELRDPPLEVWMVGRSVYRIERVTETGDGFIYMREATKPDYRFVGQLTVEQPHDLLTLKAKLIDVYRNRVVKPEQQISWFYTHPTEVRDKTKWESRDKVQELAKRFMPLDDILHKYEGMPQSASLQPQEEVIGSGQKMAIQLNQILDSYGEAAEQWQRVVVQVEKGKLTNKVPYRGDDYYFEVGDGNIKLQYEAPDECRDQTETITVKNTCEIDPNQLPFNGRDEIAQSEFKIRCIRGKFEFKWEGTSKCIAGGMTVINKYTEAGEIPFEVEWSKGQGTFDTYGTVRGRFTVTAPRFKHSESYEVKHLLIGEVIKPESETPQLDVTWERHIAGELIDQDDFTLPVRDGAEKEYPVHRVTEGCTHDTVYTITVHIDSNGIHG